MSTDSTRQRVLEAAGQVFARVGFKVATVREIVEKAGANLSAVNYHFRDKETLYREVLNHLCRSSLDQFSIEGDARPEDPVEVRLRAYIGNFLRRVLGADNQPEWRSALMTREMSEPTPMFDTVIEQVMLPVRRHLENLVAEIIGAETTSMDVQLAANGIIAQCVFYKHFERVGARFSQPLPAPGESRIELLTEHITRFSLQGMAGFRKDHS